MVGCVSLIWTAAYSGRSCRSEPRSIASSIRSCAALLTMEEMLDQYGSEINVVYCENDNEAYGAITAIRESGRKIGNDITGGEIMGSFYNGYNRKSGTGCSNCEN